MVLPRTGTFSEERRHCFGMKTPRAVARTYLHPQLMASWQWLLAGWGYLPELNVILSSLPSNFALYFLILLLFLIFQNHLPLYSIHSTFCDETSTEMSINYFPNTLFILMITLGYIIYLLTILGGIIYIHFIELGISFRMLNIAINIT